MSRIAIVIATALAFAVALSAAPAQAQRVFVAATGSDGNPCTFASPCRSFQHAHDVAPANGEIAVLDSAGYGAVTITKAISIVNPGGVEAGISVPSGGTAITVAAGQNDIVSLRGLTLDGNGVGRTGIVFNFGARLEIVDCVIRNFAEEGMYIDPTQLMTLLISNTRVLDNPTAGINLATQNNGANAAYILASIDRVTVENNGYGIYISVAANTGTQATITNSIVNNNQSAGIVVTGLSPNDGLSVGIKDSTVSNINGIGISVSGTTRVFLSQSMVFGNTTGISFTNGGGAYSAGNNDINQNQTPVSGGSLQSAPEQ
jgi:Right handed beta helix region